MERPGSAVSGGKRAATKPTATPEAKRLRSDAGTSGGNKPEDKLIQRLNGDNAVMPPDEATRSLLRDNVDLALTSRQPQAAARVVVTDSAGKVLWKSGEFTPTFQRDSFRQCRETAEERALMAFFDDFRNAAEARRVLLRGSTVTLVGSHFPWWRILSWLLGYYITDYDAAWEMWQWLMHTGVVQFVIAGGPFADAATVTDDGFQAFAAGRGGVRVSAVHTRHHRGEVHAWRVFDAPGSATGSAPPPALRAVDKLASVLEEGSLDTATAEAVDAADPTGLLGKLAAAARRGNNRFLLRYLLETVARVLAQLRNQMPFLGALVDGTVKEADFDKLLAELPKRVKSVEGSGSPHCYIHVLRHASLTAGALAAEMRKRYPSPCTISGWDALLAQLDGLKKKEQRVVITRSGFSGGGQRDRRKDAHLDGRGCDLLWALAKCANAVVGRGAADVFTSEACARVAFQAEDGPDAVVCAEVAEAIMGIALRAHIGFAAETMPAWKVAGFALVGCCRLSGGRSPTNPLSAAQGAIQDSAIKGLRVGDVLEHTCRRHAVGADWLLQSLTLRHGEDRAKVLNWTMQAACSALCKINGREAQAAFAAAIGELGLRLAPSEPLLAASVVMRVGITLAKLQESIAHLQSGEMADEDIYAWAAANVGPLVLVYDAINWALIGQFALTERVDATRVQLKDQSINLQLHPGTSGGRRVFETSSHAHRGTPIVVAIEILSDGSGGLPPPPAELLSTADLDTLHARAVRPAPPPTQTRAQRAAKSDDVHAGRRSAADAEKRRRADKKAVRASLQGGTLVAGVEAAVRAADPPASINNRGRWHGVTDRQWVQIARVKSLSSPCWVVRFDAPWQAGELAARTRHTVGRGACYVSTLHARLGHTVTLCRIGGRPALPAGERPIQGLLRSRRRWVQGWHRPAQLPRCCPCVPLRLPVRASAVCASAAAIVPGCHTVRLHACDPLACSRQEAHRGAGRAPRRPAWACGPASAVRRRRRAGAEDARRRWAAADEPLSSSPLPRQQGADAATAAQRSGACSGSRVSITDRKF